MPTVHTSLTRSFLPFEVAMRESSLIERRKNDALEQKRHFESWEQFWGRPGYGAPREGSRVQKENLMKLLHYPQAAQVRTKMQFKIQSNCIELEK